MSNKQAIWKYELEIASKQTISMPLDSLILCIQVQNEKPFLWALVSLDDIYPKLERNFVTHGTGHPIKAPIGKYIGTYQLQSGSIVFHVFEE